MRAIPHFREHVIADDLKGAYQMVAEDLNRDRRPDLIALASNMSDLVWFENLLRQLVLPKKVDNWSLTSLQQRLVTTGGRLIKHARYYWLLLAERHLTRRLFGSMVRRGLPRCPCRLDKGGGGQTKRSKEGGRRRGV